MGTKSFGLRHALLMSAAAFGLSVGVSVAQPAYAQETTRSYNIPPQDLDDALREFGRQTGRDVLFTPDSVAGKRSGAALGQLTERQALEALLAGSGLRFEQTASNGYAVRDPNSPTRLGDASGAAASDDVTDEEIVVTGTNIRGAAPVGANVVSVSREEIVRGGFTTTQDIIRSLPQNFAGGVSEDTAISATSTDAAFSNSPNLRGLGPGATLTLLNGRRLPSAGGDGQFTDVSSIPASAIHRVEVLPDGASAIYGSDAVGGVVNIVLRDDFSGLESAVRYGSVTDGGLQEVDASIFGGGTWRGGNFTAGVEYRHRDSLAATDRAQSASTDLRPLGGDDFRELGGNPGTILAGGDTYAIPAGQDGTSLTPADLVAGTFTLFDSRLGSMLLPEQQQASLFFSMRQQLSDAIELDGNFVYGERTFRFVQRSAPLFLTVPSSNAFFVDPVGGLSSVDVLYDTSADFGPGTTDGEITTLNLSMGARIEFGNDWELRPSFGYAAEQLEQLSGNRFSFAALATALADSNPATAFNPFGDGSNTNPATLDALRAPPFVFNTESRLTSLTAIASGPLFELPAGSVRLALGAGRSHEQFEGVNDAGEFGIFVTADFERQVDAAFAEVRIPLTKDLPLFSDATVSLAVRREQGDDFGATTNPRFGIEWSLTPDLQMRGSWGTSFKAPPLALLSTVNNFQVVNPFPDASAPGGFRDALIISGGNSALAPEQAETYSIGGSWRPQALHGLGLDLTYFSIQYADRIVQPNFVDTFFEDPQFADLIIRDPSAAQIDAACATGGAFFGTGNCSDAVVNGIVDLRNRNVASTETSGIDLQLSYERQLGPGEFGVFANATYLIEYQQTLGPNSPPADLLSTVLNPIDFRARAGVSYTQSNSSAAIYLNYTNGYDDNVSAPARAIDSWTTIDLSLMHRFRANDAADEDKGLSLSLNIQNLFDQDPPFVNNSAGLGYDNANADLLGRLVSVRLANSW